LRRRRWPVGLTRGVHGSVPAGRRVRPRPREKRSISGAVLTNAVTEALVLAGRWARTSPTTTTPDGNRGTRLCAVGKAWRPGPRRRAPANAHT
jgi:hypothetical protein